jgi:uncharacterized membrane protein YheB (UPF0754 family)
MNLFTKLKEKLKMNKKVGLMVCSILLSTLIALAALTPGNTDDEVLGWIKVQLEKVLSKQETTDTANNPVITE